MAPPPKVLGSRSIREQWPPITEDEIELADGERKNWVRFHFGTSAAVLPVTVEGEVVLTREYRHGLGRVVPALPGGTAEDGESPEDCAHRELLEETGLEPGKLLHM